MSFVFFGLMLLPLILFLIWLINKDRNKNYIGLIVLAVMAVVAMYAIIKYDTMFLEANSRTAPATQAPSYK
jgi:hypothetical protein